MINQTKNKLKILIFFLGFFIVSLPNKLSYGIPQEYKSTAFCDGEWLRYKVKWGFIQLGTIEVFQKKIIYDGSPAFKIMMHGQSRKLPFINVYFINEGIIDQYKPTLQHFTLTSDKDGNNVTTFIYNSQSKTISMKNLQKEQVVRLDSIVYIDDLYDALGMFMMIRCLSESGRKVKLNNIIEFQISQTQLNFTEEVDTIKVAAFDTDQKALKFSGYADWEGGKSWAGVSGSFKGWISHDSKAIPLKVKIKIFLGSIILELEDIKRKNRENTPQLSVSSKG